MTCCRQWWPTVVKNIKYLNVLVQLKSELRDIGLVYQVIACTAVWDMFSQIISKVAYNGPVFVTVPRYDRLGPYLSLYNLLWAVLGLSVLFDHISIKVTRKRESGQQWSIIIQMSCHREVWPIMATVDTVYPILLNFRQVRLKRLRMGYDGG